jgi:hypothetical protein
VYHGAGEGEGGRLLLGALTLSLTLALNLTLNPNPLICAIPSLVSVLFLIDWRIFRRILINTALILSGYRKQTLLYDLDVYL